MTTANQTRSDRPDRRNPPDRPKQPQQPSKSPGLLLVAHGSRISSSNEEIMQLSARLASRLQGSKSHAKKADESTQSNSSFKFNLISPDNRAVETASAPVVVEHAFLELTEPSIPQGIDKCAALGVTQLYVLPYFLAAGRHVRDDIPEAVEQGQARHPQMAISLLSHVGQSDAMLDLIIAMAGDHEVSLLDEHENST